MNLARCLRLFSALCLGLGLLLSPVAFASSDESNSSNSLFQDLQKPLPTLNQSQFNDAASTGGTQMYVYFVKAVFLWGAGIVALACVLIIAASGIEIMVRGASADIEESKTRILNSLFGLTVLFLGGLFLRTINPTFFTL